jgi:hypothetical protein
MQPIPLLVINGRLRSPYATVYHHVSCLHSRPAGRRLLSSITSRHTTNTLPPVVPQLKQLPQDPFHPQFLPHVYKIGGALNTYYGEAATAPLLLQHLLPLGLLPALHARLLTLGAATFPGPQSHPGSSRANRGLVTGVAAPTCSGEGVAPLTPARLEAFCMVLADITQSLMFPVMSLYRVMHQRDQTPKDLLPAFMDQLLSNPAALGVLVQCGLSAEVQAAARAGSAAAQTAMTAVGHLFRFCAVLLHRDPGVPLDATSERVEEGLCAFLNLEANQPFLEPLCLPLDFGEPHSACC